MSYPPYGGGYGRRRGGGFGGFGWGLPTPSMQPIPPPPPDILRVATSTDDSGGLNARISFRFARAPFITVVDLKNGKPVNVQAVQNTMAMGARGVGIAVGQWLISSGVRVVLAPRVGPNIMMVLSQAGVRVETVPPGATVGEALRRIGLLY